ncbi:unnamed protein product, partial [Sphenostylis stenocarpa]
SLIEDNIVPRQLRLPWRRCLTFIEKGALMQNLRVCVREQGSIHSARWGCDYVPYKAPEMVPKFWMQTVKLVLFQFRKDFGRRFSDSHSDSQQTILPMIHKASES